MAQKPIYWLRGFGDKKEKLNNISIPAFFHQHFNLDKRLYI